MNILNNPPCQRLLSHRWSLTCTTIVLLSLFVQCTFESISGGGSDIGNPPISGTVMTSDMKPVRNALVEVGSIDNDLVCDTLYTGNDGRFKSKGLPSGLYAVAGKVDSLSGIARIVHDSGKNVPLVITLDRHAIIKLRSDSLSADASRKINWAKIAGTNFHFSRSVANDLTLSKAPPGEMDIKIATYNGEIHTMRKYRAIASCDAYIIVDPSLPPERWISGGCGVRDPLGQPSIIWISPPPGSQGSIARVNRNATYDIAVQFSHPMNTRSTTLAVTGHSSDSAIQVTEKYWVGSDVLYLSFNRANPNPTRFPLGVTYSIGIDTTAESVFGVRMARQYRFSFKPEPYPRVMTVEGFRFKVASQYEIVDSLPPTISLGDSVSPSVSMLDGNKLTLTFVGTPLAPFNGIRCYQSDSVPVEGVQFTLLGNTMTIRFPSLMKSGSSYRVVIDTLLKFKEGFSFPYTQTIRWKTLRFAIDNALILGQQTPADASRTISLINEDVRTQYSASGALTPYTPYLPATAWYASAPIDTASLRKNVVIPPPFDSLPLITEGSKFGFFTNRWLPPASTFRFVVLPGLRSSAGDSLGETLAYTVTTDSLMLKEYHVFNLAAPGDQPSSVPRQDTLYDLNTSVISGTSIDNLWCYPVYHSAWVNFNAPMQLSSAGKLSISPADGFSVKRVKTGFGLFSQAMLIPDTTYTVTMQKGAVDTFGNSDQQTFEYRFKTEKFKLKIGNLFGAIFGYQQEIARLPAQMLPDVTIINQNVQGGQPFAIVISRDMMMGGRQSRISFDPLGPVFTREGQRSIGLALSVLEPGFSDRQNYLFFSGVIDSVHFRDHVHITPDDGSILLKTQGNMLQFSASLSCRAKTTYSITVDKRFSDCYGHTLGDSLSVAFSTPPFWIDSMDINSHSFGRDSIVRGLVLPLQPVEDFHFASLFNYPLGIASLENNLLISPRIPGRLIASFAKCDFIASQLLIPDTMYTISMTTAITDRFGANLDTTYTVVFRTEPFSIGSLQIGTVENKAVFSLSSNALLDASSLLPSIHVQPSRYASGRCVLSADSTGFSFIADSTLRFGDHISVVVATTLQDRFNHHPAQPDSLDFVVTVKQED